MTNAWKTVPLDSLLLPEKGAMKIGPFGSQLKKCDLVDSGVHVIGIENVLSGQFDGLGERFISSEKFRTLSSVEIRPGDLLVTMMGTIGKVAVVPNGIGTSIMDSHLLRIRPDTKLCRTDYLAWAVSGSPFVQSCIDAQAHGAIMRGLNSGIVRSLPILLPPLPEQRRIVAVLDKGSAAIATARANAEKNLQNARALFESELGAVFVRRGKGWTEKRVCDLCREITVGHVGPMAKRYHNSGIPFLRSQNVRPFEVTLDNSVFIDDTFHAELLKSQLRPGDLIIVRTGYPGTAAVVPESLPRANCSDMVIVRTGDEVDPHFMALFFNSTFGKSLVGGRLVGAAQKHFNIGAAKQVRVPFPSRSEQGRLVRAFDDLLTRVRSLDSVYRGKIAALQGLRRSLLRQAFSGAL